MSKLAGAVMIVLSLVFFGGTIGGVVMIGVGKRAAEASGGTAAVGMLAAAVPAIVLWGVALLALTGLGVIAAILATRPAPTAAPPRRDVRPHT